MADLDINISSANKDEPDAPGVIHQKQIQAVETCRDVYGGTDRLRECGQKYLLKFKREEGVNYKARLNQSVLFNAFAHTVHGLAGMVMRKNPVLADDVNQRIKDAWENIDLQGTHGDVFAAERLVDALIDGHAHVFVDQQRKGEEIQTKEDEIHAGIRPYMIGVKKQQVIRFSTVNIGGKLVLSELAWKETVTVPDGRFGSREAEQVQTFWLENGKVGFQVWRKKSDAENAAANAKGIARWVAEPAGVMDISRIPLVTIYGNNRKGFMWTDPPLLDLAHENLDHFRTRSDRRNSLHICGVPIPVFIGLEAGGSDEAEVASDKAIEVGIGGDAKYLEPTGNALPEMRNELLDIEKRMATLGLSQLQRDTRAAETAEAKRIDKSEGNSKLSRTARSLEDALEEAFGLMAEWLGIEHKKKTKDAGGSISINRDFEQQLLEPTMITALETMVVTSHLSMETMWEILKAGEVLPSSFDPETEKDRILNGMLSLMPVPEPPKAPGEEEDEEEDEEDEEEDEKKPAVPPKKKPAVG